MVHWNMKTRKRDTWATRPAEKRQKTEAHVLSGITRKSNMRSTFYWFTESCNSQCLSHFAAPFIVVRAETAITGSCVVHTNWKPSTKMENIKMVKIIVKKVASEHLHLSASLPLCLVASLPLCQCLGPCPLPLAPCPLGPWPLALGPWPRTLSVC